MVLGNVLLLESSEGTEGFFPPLPQTRGTDFFGTPVDPTVAVFDVTFTPVKSQPLFASDTGVSSVGPTSFVEELAEAFNSALRAFDPTLLNDMFFFAVPGFDQKVRLCLKTVLNSNTQNLYFTFVLETRGLSSDEAYALGGFEEGLFYSSVPFLYEDNIASGVVTPVAAPFFLGAPRYMDIFVDQVDTKIPLERVYLSGLKGGLVYSPQMRILRDPIRVLKELTVRPLLQDGSTPVLTEGDGFDYSFDIFHVDHAQSLPPITLKRTFVL